MITSEPDQRERKDHQHRKCCHVDEDVRVCFEAIADQLEGAKETNTAHRANHPQSPAYSCELVVGVEQVHPAHDQHEVVHPVPRILDVGFVPSFFDGDHHLHE